MYYSLTRQLSLFTFMTMPNMLLLHDTFVMFLFKVYFFICSYVLNVTTQTQIIQLILIIGVFAQFKLQYDFNTRLTMKIQNSHLSSFIPKSD